MNAPTPDPLHHGPSDQAGDGVTAAHHVRNSDRDLLHRHRRHRDALEHISGRQIASSVFWYVVFAGLWILLSDYLVSLVIRDPHARTIAGIVKGWVFVAVTALLLFASLRRLHLRLSKLLDELQAHELGELRTLRLLDAIADSSDDAIFAKDVSGRYLVFNRAAGEMIGWAPAEVLGQTDHALFPQDQADALRAVDLRVLEDGQNLTIEEHLTTRNGDRVYLSTKGPLHGPGGEMLGMFGIARDITERNRHEQTLAESERFKNAVLNSVDANIAVIDPGGTIIAVNEAWMRFGRASTANGTKDAKVGSGRTANGKPVLAGIGRLGVGANYLAVCRAAAQPGVPNAPSEAAADARQALAGIEEVLAGRTPVFRMEYRCPHPDGTIAWYAMSVTPLEGGRAGVVIAHTSITERKRIEQDLRELSLRQRALLANLPDLVWLKDPQGVYLACNPRMEALLGMPEGQVIGKTDFDFFDAATARRFCDGDQAAMASQPGNRGGLTFEEELCFASDGHCETVQTVKVPLHDDQGRLTGVLGIARDISSIKSAESVLRRQANEITERNAELERFNRMMVGRELDMIALKERVNALMAELGRIPPYPGRSAQVDAPRPGESRRE